MIAFDTRNRIHLIRSVASTRTTPVRIVSMIDSEPHRLHENLLAGQNDRMAHGPWPSRISTRH